MHLDPSEKVKFEKSYESMCQFFVILCIILFLQKRFYELANGQLTTTTLTRHYNVTKLFFE